jgi:hypothetical protein
MQGNSSSATVGIENHQGNDGLQVVNNASYLENNLALQFSAEPEWLLLNNYQGTIYNGNSLAVILTFLTEGLELGDYSMDMVITSNDPTNPEIIVPIAMEVLEVPVELTSFTAVSTDNGVEIKWTTATETNNQGFEIERLNPQSEIRNTQFEKVGYVAGFGTTTEPRSYSFTDDKISSGTYTYRLKQIDFDGSINYSPEVEIEVSGPKDFALYQNYPNPFNPITTIKFALPEKTNLLIAIYNTIGEKVAEIFNGELEEGYHEVEFNAANLPSGVYFYRFESDKFNNVKKMIIMK